jgi:hypothetical protein
MRPDEPVIAAGAHLDEGDAHAFIDGALGDEAAARVIAHVAACERCAALLAEARGLTAASTRILGALDDVPGQVVPSAPAAPPAATVAPFPARVAASPVSAKVAGGARGGAAWRRAPWRAAAAVLIAAGIGATAWLNGDRARRAEGEVASAATDMRAGAPELALPTAPAPAPSAPAPEAAVIAQGAEPTPTGAAKAANRVAEASRPAFDDRAPGGPVGAGMPDRHRHRPRPRARASWRRARRPRPPRPRRPWPSARRLPRRRRPLHLRRLRRRPRPWTWQRTPPAPRRRPA